jgi:hypothetical protein
MLLACLTTTGAATDLVAASATKKIRVWYIQYGMDGTGDLSIHFGTAGATTRLVYSPCVAGSQGFLDFSNLGGVMSAAINTALKVTTSAQTAKVTVGYDLQ